MGGEQSASETYDAAATMMVAVGNAGDVAATSTSTSFGSSGSIDEEELAVMTPMAEAGEQLLNEVMDTAAAAAANTTLVPVSSEPDETEKETTETTETTAAAAGGDPGPTGSELIARRSQEVVSRLIGAREGAALRRVSYEACSVSLASYLASDKAAPLRRAGIETMSAVLQDLWTLRKAELAATNQSSSSLTDRDLWPESEDARVIREREEKTQRKALNVIVKGHLKKLWRDGPRGMLLLVNLAFTALRMSMLAVMYATCGATKEWTKRGCRAVLRLITAPVRLVTKIAAAGSTASPSVSTAAAGQEGTVTGATAQMNGEKKKSETESSSKESF